MPVISAPPAFVRAPQIVSADPGAGSTTIQLSMPVPEADCSATYSEISGPNESGRLGAVTLLSAHGLVSPFQAGWPLMTPDALAVPTTSGEPGAPLPPGARPPGLLA